MILVGTMSEGRIFAFIIGLVDEELSIQIKEVETG